MGPGFRRGVAIRRLPNRYGFTGTNFVVMS
jgi:hypothetical protein